METFGCNRKVLRCYTIFYHQLFLGETTTLLKKQKAFYFLLKDGWVGVKRQDNSSICVVAANDYYGLSCNLLTL